MLAVFDTCKDFIRTAPVLQHDRLRREDVDTAAEDHIADETRYACLARIMMPKPLPRPETTDEAWTRTWERPGRRWATRQVLNWKVL